MKKIVRVFLAVATLSTGFGIGTIALYANNDGFKVFLDSMIDKYAGNEHPSEYVIAEVASTDYVSSYHENQIVYNDMVSNYSDEDSSIQVIDLPEDYWQQAYNDTYGVQPGEASYENYTYDETSDGAASYEATSESESSDMQVQEDTSTAKETVTQQPSESAQTETVYVDVDGEPVQTEWHLPPFELWERPEEERDLWIPDSCLYPGQILAIHNAPWKEAGFNIVQDAWHDFLSTQWAHSMKTGGDDFARWCTDIVNGVGSKYDNYMPYDPTANLPGMEW